MSADGRTRPASAPSESHAATSPLHLPRRRGPPQPRSGPPWAETRPASPPASRPSAARRHAPPDPAAASLASFPTGQQGLAGRRPRLARGSRAPRAPEPSAASGRSAAPDAVSRRPPPVRRWPAGSRSAPPRPWLTALRRPEFADRRRLPVVLAGDHSGQTRAAVSL
nr:WAS/WASL-interacting protein family member 2-like [Aegilops tauschii subsp. strangulata]